MFRTPASWQRLSRTGVVLLLVRGAPLAAQGGAGGSTPEDSVRAVELARAQALLRADTVALSRMVADEFVEISRLGQLRTKADNIRDIGSGQLRLTSVKYDSPDGADLWRRGRSQRHRGQHRYISRLPVQRQDQVPARLRPA